MEKFFKTWSPLKPCEPDNTDLAINKSRSNINEPDGVKLWVESWLCTEKPDSENDIMEAREVDLEYYKSNGYMCHEHPSLALTLVGRNTKAWVEEHESGFLGVKQRGYFYGKDKEAKTLYEKMIVLSEAEDDPSRHLGTSAEGKSLEAIPRPGGGHILRKNKIWGTAVTHRPKNDLSRFTGALDVAKSLHEAAEGGYLRHHLETLLENHKLAERILSVSKSQKIDPQIEILMSRYGMSLAQAETLITKLRPAQR